MPATPLSQQNPETSPLHTRKRLMVSLARKTGKGLVVVYACFGFILTTLFIASFFHLTNVQGKFDSSSYMLNVLAAQLTHQKTAVLAARTTSADTNSALQKTVSEHISLLCQVKLLSYIAPDNAGKIYAAYQDTQSDELLINMTTAAEFHIDQSSSYAPAFKECTDDTTQPIQQLNLIQAPLTTNLYKWETDNEHWPQLQTAILKDKAEIIKAARIAQIEPRMLIAPLFVEQWRAYTSERELFKDLLKPLQTLATSTTFSLGTMNIKEDVAIEIENNLKNPNSEYYLGPSFTHLLDFTTPDTHNERYKRLANYADHSYSYLYAALYLKELETQWQKHGIDIAQRPEIIATLFNIGFSKSHPHPNPGVGGAEIDVNGTAYTFGKLAYEFYYSGELLHDFPYESYQK